MATLFERNLIKCGQDITLFRRSIVPPIFGTPDFDENFSDPLIIPALIKTERGRTLFDGVATDQVITHIFCIAWISGVSAEDWIRYDGRLFDVLDVENCCETNEKLKLRCRERGTQKASEA